MTCKMRGLLLPGSRRPVCRDPKCRVQNSGGPGLQSHSNKEGLFRAPDPTMAQKARGEGIWGRELVEASTLASRKGL